MTVARLTDTRHNAKPPELLPTALAACNCITGFGVAPTEGEEADAPFITQLRGLSKGARTMVTSYSHSRPEGRSHRDKIARWILPKLHPGCRVPSANWMARFLGISSSEGGRQIRRALTEAGIATETRGVGRGRRIYVVTLGERP
jgi:hypothetical protein